MELSVEILSVLLKKTILRGKYLLWTTSLDNLLFAYSRDNECDSFNGNFNSGKITIEFRPLTTASWLKVQSRSFNPRVRYVLAFDSFTTFIFIVYCICIYYYSSAQCQNWSVIWSNWPDKSKWPVVISRMGLLLIITHGNENFSRCNFTFPFWRWFWLLL